MTCCRTRREFNGPSRGFSYAGTVLALCLLVFAQPAAAGGTLFVGTDAARFSLIVTVGHERLRRVRRHSDWECETERGAVSQLALDIDASAEQIRQLA